MKKNWQPLMMEIISMDTRAQDVLTSSPNSEVGIDFDEQWGAILGGKSYD